MLQQFIKRSAARLCFAIAALALCGGGVVAAVEDGPSFTEAQAARGRTIYSETCASCHGRALEGGAGPALKGVNFSKTWGSGEHTIGQLHTSLTTMPLGLPNSLPKEQYLELMAFILSSNGYSSGGAALTDADFELPLPPMPSVETAHVDDADDGEETDGPRKPAAGLPRLVSAAPGPTAPTPPDRDLQSPADGDWLMYNRDYRGQRFSPLDQINTRTASRLAPVCILQLGDVGSFQASPIVHEGRGYVTTTYGVYAFDAATCRRIWDHRYTPQDPEPIPVNRGVALYQGKLYRGTSDGHLLALDAANGRLLWDMHVADSTAGYFVSAAPIAVAGKVIVGLAGADWGANGHVYAFDAETGQRVWTFDFIPTGSQRGAETWEKGQEHGGGSSWTTVAVDPDANLVYVPVGNPAPDFDVAGRPGSNLYTNSVVALDIDTGELNWYAQQQPGDFHDWDTAAAPLLYEQDGRRYMAVATKGGWLFIYDRDTHALISKSEISSHENVDTPLSETSWVRVCPGLYGGAEWNGPAYSAPLRSLFVGSVEWCTSFQKRLGDYVRGKNYSNGITRRDPNELAKGWLRAFDAASGKQLWVYADARPMVSGVTATAGNILLAGSLTGDMLVFDAAKGKVLYRFNTGGPIAGGLSTYAVDGRQYVAAASGNVSRSWGGGGAATIVVFALPTPGRKGAPEH